MRLDEGEGSCYSEILFQARPVSRRHRPMPRENRAAQFAPFAALTGFEALIEEGGRRTEQRIELSDTQREALDRTLSAILAMPDPPTVSITYFEPDRSRLDAYILTQGEHPNRDAPNCESLRMEGKSGGRYVETTGVIKRCELGEVLLRDGRRIAAGDIIGLHCES